MVILLVWFQSKGAKYMRLIARPLASRLHTFLTYWFLQLFLNLRGFWNQTQTLRLFHSLRKSATRVFLFSLFKVTWSLKRLCKQPLLVIVKGNLPELTPTLTLTLNAKYNLSFENSLQFSKKGVLTKIEWGFHSRNFHIQFPAKPFT